MNQDFRVKIGFFDHPKTRRLRQRHGDSGILCLMQLWEFAAQYRPKGVFHDMEPDEIAAVSKWSGGREFVDSLVEFRFLDQSEQGFALHDWAMHNGWAYRAEERSAQARKAAEKKWVMTGGKRNAKKNG